MALNLSLSLSLSLSPNPNPNPSPNPSPDPGPNPDPNQVRVELRHDPSGLSAWLGASPLFEHVPLPDFAPLRSWRVGLGARCGAAHDRHWVDELRLSRGARCA